MSDDRLFASNNAIGRKWYFINLLILFIMVLITNYAFDNFIIPNTRTETYKIIAQGILYFAYAIYIITFFALIERRLYDVCGSRETKSYKNISAVLRIIILVQIFALFCIWKQPVLPVSVASITTTAYFLDGIFIIIMFALGILKGQITNLSYDEYKNKTKYQ